jgi:hypothetical protein
MHTCYATSKHKHTANVHSLDAMHVTSSMQFALNISKRYNKNLLN